jgi:hypothetical protein
MIRQCFACNTGILFDTASLVDVGIDVLSVWPVYIPNKVPVVGPSPNAMEHYEAKSLPPIWRRSSALKAAEDKRQQSKKSQLANGRMSDKNSFQADLFTDDEKRLLELLPEQVEDHFDALQPINDMLKDAKAWWILEVLPIKLKIQERPDQWVRKMGANLGRFRPVQEIEPKMHWTVKLRMERENYKLKNSVSPDVYWILAA